MDIKHTCFTLLDVDNTPNLKRSLGWAGVSYAPLMRVFSVVKTKDIFMYRHVSGDVMWNAYLTRHMQAVAYLGSQKGSQRGVRVVSNPIVCHAIM